MVMPSQVSLVVGASRGIGLELAKELHSTTAGHVFATCRTQSTALSELQGQSSTFHAVSGVDVESTEGCEPLAALPVDRIDVVICNAGVLMRHDSEFSSLSLADCTWQFNTNALGPLRAVQALLPKLKRGSKVIIIGSRLGSFREAAAGSKRMPLVGYRMSKCAVHMAVRCLAEDLRPRGIAVAVVHPGVVATDMLQISGFQAEVSPQESAAGIARVVAGLGIADTDSFYNHLGEEMAW